jgi:hypothetical protein
MSGHAILPKMPKPHGPMSIMNPDLLQVGQRGAKHLDTQRNCLWSRREELRLTYQDWRENPDGNKVELRWNKQGNGAENQKGWWGVCREVSFKDLSLVPGFSNHPDSSRPSAALFLPASSSCAPLNLRSESLSC